jgi:hypothetical protein
VAHCWCPTKGSAGLLPQQVQVALLPAIFTRLFDEFQGVAKFIEHEHDSDARDVSIRNGIAVKQAGDASEAMVTDTRHLHLHVYDDDHHHQQQQQQQQHQSSSSLKHQRSSSADSESGFDFFLILESLL